MAVVVTCSTTDTTTVELVAAEAAIKSSYIDNPDQPRVMLAKCSTNRSSSDVVADLTVNLVDRCATTATSLVELVDGGDKDQAPCIGTSNYSKVTPTRCSTVVININDIAIKALLAPPIKSGSWQVFRGRTEPSQVMAFQPSVVFSSERTMHTRCSMKGPRPSWVCNQGIKFKRMDVASNIQPGLRLLEALNSSGIGGGDDLEQAWLLNM
uniref:Uncharacterized protein n=1 Tax=Oryza punctata TaxID=4537 RepID=A0A0E0K4T6_ORYPU